MATDIATITSALVQAFRNVVGDGRCETNSPLMINTVGASGLANRCYFMRLTGTKRGATKVRIGVGTASGNISAGIYANNGSDGEAAGPTGAPLASTASLAMSGLLQDDGSAIGANTSVFIPFGATLDVPDGAWLALSMDNVTATLSRSNNPTHSSQIKGRLVVQNSAFPVPATVGTVFVSTPHFVASVL